MAQRCCCIHPSQRSLWPPFGGLGIRSCQGESSPPNTGVAGGAGTANSITGASVTYAGGGGGGGVPGASPGAGGSGGGGAGNASGGAGTAGTVNTGGGGGGGASPGCGGGGGAGGSGIVVLRIAAACAPGCLAAAPGTNTITDDGSDKVIKFTVDGTLTI